MVKPKKDRWPKAHPLAKKLQSKKQFNLTDFIYKKVTENSKIQGEFYELIVEMEIVEGNPAEEKRVEEKIQEWINKLLENDKNKRRA